MDRTRNGPPGPRVAVVRPIPNRTWTVLALAAGVVSAIAVIAGRDSTAVVRVTLERRVPASTVLAAMAVVGLVSALLGRGREWLGLSGLAAVSFGASVTWLLLDDHPFAGPVLLTLSGGHGIHRGDAVALVPAIVGLAVLARVTYLLFAALQARRTG